MNFRVIWLRISLASVARAYGNLLAAGGDAESVTRAMARIDTLLERNPYDCGDSRSLGERILIEPPLSVRYEVHDAEQVAVVWKVVYRPPPG
jgi:hypothetical protein